MRLRCNALVVLTWAASVLAFPPRLSADDGNDTEPVKELILPGESFLVEGRPAFVLRPPEGIRQNPQPWILYAPTLPGYPDEHEKWMHEQFLAAGVSVAGIDVGEAYGSPDGRKLFTALYTERELGGVRRPLQGGWGGRRGDLDRR